MVNRHFLAALLTTLLLITSQVFGQIAPVQTHHTVLTNLPGLSPSSGSTVPSIPGISSGGTAPNNAVTFPVSSSGPLKLTVDSLDSNFAYLSWTLPPGFVPVNTLINYKSANVNTNHSIKPATSTTAKIARAKPVGASERWKLIVRDASGTIAADVVKLDGDYGGAILVIEDVYFGKAPNTGIFRDALNNCVNPDPTIMLYAFRDIEIVSTVSRACTHMHEFAAENHFRDLSQVRTDEDVDRCEAYTYRKLLEDFDDDHRQVFPFSILQDPRWYFYDGPYPQGRSGLGIEESTAFSIYPNPAQDFINIRIEQAQEASQISLMNRSDHTIASSRYTDKRSGHTLCPWRPAPRYVSNKHTSSCRKNF
jgi:hypothetical protein